MGDDVRRVGDAQDDAGEAGGLDLCGHVLQDFNGLAQGVHAGLSLTHVRQGACGHDEQLGVLGVGVVPGSDDGALAQVEGGVIQIQCLGFRLLLVDVDVDDLFHQPLREQGVACVGANMASADDDDLSFQYFHLVLPSQCLFFLTTRLPTTWMMLTMIKTTMTVTQVTSVMFRSWPY